MSTINQLAELILKRHYGGMQTFDGTITQRQVILHIMQARDAMIRVQLWESMKMTGDKEIDPNLLWSLPNNTYPATITPASTRWCVIRVTRGISRWAFPAVVSGKRMTAVRAGP